MSLSARRLIRAAGTPPTAWDVAVLPHHAWRLGTGSLTTVHEEAVSYAFDPPLEAAPGDLLELEDGRGVQLLPAEEEILEIAAQGAALAELAYGAGAAGLAAQIEPEALQLLDSPEARAFCRARGLEPAKLWRPFAPLLGAPRRKALAPFVAALARGPSKSRHLTREEAREAFRLALAGEARPEALGAMLMLLRYRSEDAAEAAGIVEAMRETLAPGWSEVGAAVDWPAYAAGASRGLPLFLLSAKLLARAGLPVLLHGWTPLLGPTPEAGSRALGIAVTETPEAAKAALAAEGIAFAPLAALNPRFQELMKLREVFGLRSPVNSCLRALNPARAETSLQGVFHPPYRDLQRDAAVLLEQPRFMALKGGGGEFERHPAKAVELYRLEHGAILDDSAPPVWSEKRRLAAEKGGDPADLAALWAGRLEDEFSASVATGTAALALLAAGAAPDVAAAQARAEELWANRR
ncbi:glycosyl transferase family protein [Neomegalonema sp.]|uniref:glycosyl transferase family protein n=1 Tax=Neomegalonema sp. TaxID=2039713 RepID=UPI00260E7149|nr:glycosyl transferase family protein [Neomegalonema sp.]MDD2868606.1 glycosyl transferase family protein [Neomegalonema sp.]